MFGRRPDGRRVKGIDPVMQITPYVMPMRCDAQVFLKHRADLEAMSRYIRRQKQERGETLFRSQTAWDSSFSSGLRPSRCRF